MRPCGCRACRRSCGGAAGRVDTLEGVAELADRVVLDDDRPEADLAHAPSTLFEDTAFSDLRWARLTQWRALMAHFFDIPEVLAAAEEFSRLTIAASDQMSARLFAAWLESSIAVSRADSPWS